MLKYLLGFATTAVLLSAVSIQAQQEDVLVELGNGIAAIAENEIITVEQLRREMEPIVPRLRAQARNEEQFATSVNQVGRELLQNIIDRILIVKDAEEKGLLIPQSYIDQEYDEILNRDFGGDRGRLLDYLQVQGLTVREFRENIYDRVVFNYMRQQNRKSQSEISPERIQSFYLQNKIRFYQDEAMHLRQIILNVSEEGDLAEIAAEEIIQKLEAGSDFSDLADEYNSPEMGRRGGDWSWVKREDMRKELGSVAFELEPGEYSQPIELGGTVFILYCEDKREEMIQPVTEVRDAIENVLVGEIARETQEEWLQRLRENGYVRYYLQ